MLRKFLHTRIIMCADDVNRSARLQATGEVAPLMSSHWKANCWLGFSGDGERFGGTLGSVGGRECGSRAAAGPHEPRLATRGGRRFRPAVLFGGRLPHDHGGEARNAAGRGARKGTRLNPSH